MAKINTVTDTYDFVGEDLIARADLATLAKAKYQIPKYAVKMATGTGKTWVMHAMLLWQMLNARHEDEPSGRFTKNFLIVAPGLIVYDRLLDAFCGRIKRGTEYRDFDTNDFVLNQDVFIPVHLRQEVFSFIQNNVVTKEEGIGRKSTGDGMIALTNWHLFENQLADYDQQEEGEMTVPQIIEQLLPIRPGKAAGNDLGMLDRRSFRGTEIEYLTGLKDIMVINDEAHHIHELKRGGEIDEVEWKSLTDEAKEVALMAKEKNIRVSLEWHRNTVTDSNESALRFLSSVNEANFGCFWQPTPNQSVEYRAQGIEKAISWITNIHVYYWDESGRRPLTEGKEDWKEYLGRMTGNRYLLLEFVKDNSVDQFKKDAETLLSWINGGKENG